jgi:ABC-type sugar transport system, permease component
MSKKSRSVLGTIGFHCFVLLSSLLMIYPILWLAASSLKSPSEIWLKIYSLIPEAPSLDSYVRGWKGFGGISFTTFYINSTLFATLGTLFAIVSSAFIAFGFARIDFKGKSFFFACMLITLMIPTQIQIIPQYIIFSKMRWVNTYLPLIVPRLFGQAFFIFMFVQFMRGVPRELDEAVAIDGGGRITVFGKVILPLMKPALFTGSIFSFYWTWNEFFTPLVYLNKPKQYTLSLALRSFSDPSGLTDWGAIFAMSFLSLVPVFFLFIAFQKYLVEGIATTGIKG